jgi:hypothetical protein
MIFQSIKWRLQIWYGLILVAVLAGFGFTAFELERNLQLRRLDEELQRRLAPWPMRCTGRIKEGRPSAVRRQVRLQTTRRPTQIQGRRPHFACRRASPPCLTPAIRMIFISSSSFEAAANWPAP